MIKSICNVLKTFGSTYIASYEGISTLLIILVVLLKLFINRKATAIHFKRTLVSIPSEITFLVIGFLLSAMLSSNKAVNMNIIVACIVISLIVLIIQYALERWLDDHIIGKLNFAITLCILIMYIVSVLLYIIVVYGGVI